MTALKRILLAEDDPKDVELTLAALAQHNLANEVIVVHDGEQALAYLRREGNFKDRSNGNPVVVLLDLKMPKINGLEVLRQMRSDPQLKVVPVVMLTSSREERDVADSYNRGVNAYVVKPVDFTELITAVKNLGVFWALVNEPPPGSVKGNRR